jgi:hypothetical protein
VTCSCSRGIAFIVLWLVALVAGLFRPGTAVPSWGCDQRARGGDGAATTPPRGSTVGEPTLGSADLNLFMLLSGLLLARFAPAHTQAA